MITPRMYQVKYDASLRTVLSNFRFTLWGPAPHHSLKIRIFFWLPARWASGFSGDHQQDHQCLWLLLCYLFVLSFITCILLGIKLLLLLLSPIEHVWDEMDRRLRQQPNQPITLQGLGEALQEVWQEIPQAFNANLVASMRRGMC